MEECTNTLKKCFQAASTSSISERKHLFSIMLTPCVQLEELTEGHVKGIAKIFSITVFRYCDGKSKSVVMQALRTFLLSQGVNAAKVVVAELDNLAKMLNKTGHSKPFTKTALTLLKWCKIIYESVKDLPDKEIASLAAITALLSARIFSSRSDKISKRTFKLLSTVWKSFPVIFEKSFEHLIDADSFQVESLCHASICIRYLTEAKETHKFESNKGKLLESYLKLFINCKTAPNLEYLRGIKFLLKHISHESYKGLVLPAIQKAMLRNPETILHSVSNLFLHLKIDLSQYAEETGKSLTNHLIGQYEHLRASAVDAFGNLAKQCSDPDAIEKLINLLSDVLYGSEGKLTKVEQRHAVIQALTSISSSSVSGKANQERLAHLLYNKILRFLEQEGHEGILVDALKMLSLWTCHITKDIPTNFPEVLKKALNAKASTSIVRTLYLQVAASIYKGDTLHEVIPLLDVFLQSAEKVKTQSHLTQVVAESLTASIVLESVSTLDDVSKSQKIQSFWTMVLDPEKCYFTSEKFLTSASEMALEQLMMFMGHLFTNHSSLLNEAKSRPWYRATALLLLHPAWNIRKCCKSLLKSVIDSLHASPSAAQTAILNEMSDLLQSQKVNEAVDVDAVGSPERNLRNINAKTFLEGFEAVVFAIDELSDEDKEKLCLRTLIDGNHPVLKSQDGNLWERILNSFDIDLPAFIQRNRCTLLSMVQEGDSISQAQQSSLSTLLKSGYHALLPDIVQTCLDVLGDNQLTLITDHEYGIMQTSDGDVYDKSIIESAKQVVENKNVKRESKAYSFKEQKLEMELKAELNKKEGGKKAEEKPKLTKKQQEMLDDLIKSEKDIRERLLKLECRLRKHIALIEVSVQSVPSHFAVYTPLVQSSLANLIHSPLAAPHAVPLYIELKNCVFPDELKHLGNLIAYVTIRQLQPSCEIDKNWCAEDLLKETKRAIQSLFSFVTTRNVPMLMTYTEKKLLSSLALSYCLPLIRIVLRERGSRVKSDEETRSDALQLMLLHSKQRAVPEDDASQQNMKLLPRKDLLLILSDVIVSAEGHNKEAKIQQTAAQILVEVCKSGTGNGILVDDILPILTRNLMSASPVLRHSSLEGLHALIASFPEEGSLERESLASKILLAKYDVEQNTRDLAERVWEEGALTISPNVSTELLEDIVIPLENVRVAASSALAAALEEYPAIAPIIRDQLLEMYEEESKIPPPVFDNLGRLASAPFIDKWEARAGIAMGLQKIASFIPVDEIEDLFNFFVPGALGDRNETVRKHVLDAAISTVNAHGKEKMVELLSIFDKFLGTAGETSSHDIIRQSVIILMGSLAKHLDKTDPKIRPIIWKLMGALSTPSQQVQEAVASCLAPLCSSIKDEAASQIQSLLDKLLKAEKYGDRRGAAYGLAGMVKGLGILSLKQHDIIGTLTTAIQNKKIYQHREGALFAFETFCNMLGRLFEPYVVQLLPHLLLCFGDGNQYVREAADETAKAVMRNLSAHGVKLVLPSLLKALEEDSWRTKTGSIELLGAMAYCAPKQLSACLPSVVPKLIEVLADSHSKVQKAGQQALKQIGSVIRNPEIQEISPIILAALSDPANNTVPCLQALLNTSFVHFIDAPSLAIIMPILEKANVQRSTETKKMSAQIIGNMYALTDQKDLAPYLPAVIPGLKKSLLDPSPEVRGVSARALGAMVRGMGEDSFNDLLPWLLETLTSEQSSVDRSGAAQGLAEVLHGLGTERLDKLMPDVIKTTSKEDLAPHVREGYLMLYIYLPATFGDHFSHYVGPIVPSLLKGLSDESEFVRATSLKAGQRIITAYADTAVSLFLPELDKGLFDDNWRIRYSSIQLLGDLLFKVTGVSGKMTTHGDEDDNFGTAHSTKAIMDLLGPERRNRVLAGLYMGRSDVAFQVRQASLHVWKVVVHNTAKTLREILPSLFSLLLGCLAGTSYDKRQTAGRTLGDLVRKLGERVLPEIIPILEKGLDSERSDERQGVCIGISEIVKSTNRDMIIMFEDSLVVTVRRALLDPLPEVREAAGNAFDKLHDTIAQKALDGILPYVLQKLNDDECAERALDGLRNVMTVKSRVVLPFLVPRLTKPPVNTRALAILSTVAGDALTRHLNKIIPAMFQAIDKNSNEFEQNQAIEGTKALILSVEDLTGITTIVDQFISNAGNKSPGIRKASTIMIRAFCSGCKADYSDFIQQLLQVILNLMNDADEAVYTEAWGALDALIKRLDPAEQMQHIGSLRKAIQYAAQDAREGKVPGFCIIGKGINAIYPVYKEGILNGSPELKEQSAKLLGEVVSLTTPEALKPALNNVTGPLIRIFGDRFSLNVKVAILDTLSLLLSKVGIMLKPFLPQLQTTFIRALNDKIFTVRDKAISALTLLTALHTKVDSLFTELRNCIKNNEESAIRESILKALRSVTLTAGSKMSETVRKNLIEILVPLLGSTEDDIRVGSGGALGSLCSVMSEFEIKDLFSSQLLDMDESLDWTLRHGRTVALSYAIFDAPAKLHEIISNDVITKSVLTQACADRIPIAMYGVHSLGHVMISNALAGKTIPGSIVDAMRKSLLHSSSDVRLTAMKTLSYVAERVLSSLEPNVIKCFVMDLISCCRDRNTSIRSASEQAMISLLSLRDGDQQLEETSALLSSDVADKLRELRRGNLSKTLHSSDNEEGYLFVVNLQGQI